jgi:hypothetical protein
MQCFQVLYCKKLISRYPFLFFFFPCFDKNKSFSTEKDRCSWKIGRFETTLIFYTKYSKKKGETWGN